jgi:hypothetical protein
MNNRINTCFSKLLVSMILPGFLLTANGFAQTDKNEAKMLNLKNRIALAESKVAAAELKLTVADSLITHGETAIEKAETEFSRIGEEQKQLEKDYKANSKELNKLAKSKDEETAKKAALDLKALDAQFKVDLKTYATEIKLLAKQASKGDSDMKKGMDMQKASNVKLRDAQKALELANENYEVFVQSIESE